jgi:hypothetical protein
MTRVSTWLIVVTLAGLGVVAGAAVVGAQGAEEEPAADDAPGRFDAFLDCAADQGIELPDIRQHRRDRQPLTDDERAAAQQAREACGDQLPHAEDRQALRACLTDALAEDTTSSIRSLARTCAEDVGIEVPHRHRRCRRPH